MRIEKLKKKKKVKLSNFIKNILIIKLLIKKKGVEKKI